MPGSESPAAAPRLCIIGEADLFIARLLRRYATTCGLTTLCVQTGEDVLAWTQADRDDQTPPVLIVLEPELPGRVRGWEAAQALWGDCEALGIPIILCSWLGEAEAQALVGQAAPHLQKPDVHYEDFVAALERLGVLPAAQQASNQNCGGSQ